MADERLGKSGHEHEKANSISPPAVDAELRI
jgi:hypothetical protein